MGRVGVGFIVDRVGRFEYVITGLITCLALAVLAPLLITGTGGCLIFLAFWVIGTTAGSIAEAMLLTRAFGIQSFATILGAVVVVETTGQLITPSAAGAIFDATGSYDFALVMFGAIFAGSFLLLMLASRMRRPLLETVAA